MPEKEGYSFGGWYEDESLTTEFSLNSSKPKGEVTAYAKWVADQHTVTWSVNGKETAVAYDYGTIPAFPGSLAKVSTNTSIYTFIGWDCEGTLYKVAVPAVKQDAKYTAVYSEATRYYTVVWSVDGVDTEFKYTYGETLTAPKNVTKPADSWFSYEFSGWGVELPETVTASATYTAVFTQVEHQYIFDIAFDVNGTKTVYPVAKDLEPSYKGTPAKAPTNTQQYTFMGWKSEDGIIHTIGDALPVATEETTYTAIFAEAVRLYSVNFVVGKNTTTEQYEYNETPSFSGTPAIADTNTTIYTFSGWDNEFALVTADTTYTANFTETDRLYTITFVTANGSVTEDYKYNEVPSIADPTKASTTTTVYTFSGWDKVFSAVTANATYTANFTASTRYYTVTFVAGDSKTTEQYEYNQTPSFSGTPEKEQINTTVYTFSGWDKAFSAVTTDITYTATFAESTRYYVITFVAGDITTTAEYEYNQTPSFGATPEKASTTTTDYTFSGWDKVFGAVTENTTYTAKFTGTDRLYTITFVTPSGAIEKNYKYNDDPSIADPTKASTATTVYTFKKWDKAFSLVTKNTTYTAQFTESTRYYDVTFVVGNSSTTEQYEYNESPNFSGTPTKTPTNTTVFTFSGWDKVLDNVTKDTTYTATFTESTRQYTIKWIDNTGTTTATYEYCASLTTPADPADYSDSSYSYTFTGWTPSVVTTVVADATYTAQFSQEEITTYSIRWMDYMDNWLATSTVEQGATPDYPNATPSRANTNYFTYEFSGWSTSPSGVVLDPIPSATANAVYYTVFEATAVTYAINWYDDAGTTLYGTTSVSYGEVPVYTGTPTKDATPGCTYTFKGWATSANSNTIVTIGQAIAGTSYYAVFESHVSASVGLEFAPVTGGYEVYGIGNCIDADIVIPAEYTNPTTGVKGPVLGIGSHKALNQNDYMVTFGAFEGLTEITSITIPDSVKYIDEETFYGCSSIETITLGENTALTTIGEKAFYGCEKLTTFDIPEALVALEPSTFYGCSSLDNIAIPASLTEVGQYAFYNCSSLSYIEIPDNITVVGQAAFRNCTSLITVVIGKGCAKIGYGAFNTLTSLEEVTINAPITTYKSESGYSYPRSDYQYPFGDSGSADGCSIILADTVEEIGSYIFKNCQFTDIYIGANVKEFEVQAFYGCESANAIYINGTADDFCNISLGGETAHPLNECSGTRTIYVKNDANEYELVKDVVVTTATRVSSFAFYNVDSIETVTIGSSVGSIGERAFYGCGNLTTVTMEDGISFIGEAAFCYCTELTTLTIPASVTEIDYSAFQYCYALTTLNLNATYAYTDAESKTYVVYERSPFYEAGKDSGLTVIVGENVVGIDKYMFSNTTNIVSIEFKDATSWYHQYAYDSEELYMDVSDPTVAASNVLSYYGHYWEKK